MKRKYWVLLITCFVVLSLDQWTKYEVQQKLYLHQTIKVINGFFNLTHLRNTGGAFGIFGGERGGLGSLFFIVVSLIAIGSILLFFLKMKEDEKSLSLPLSLILSGAIGNLADRLFYGEVVDFLDFYLFSFHWPAFNVADSSITIGIGLMAFNLIFQDRRRSAKSQAPDPK